MLNSWLHVIALTVYLGAIVALRAMLLPAASALDDQSTRAQFLVRGFKLYNPIQIGALGILLFTGAFQLTDLKAAYRELFVQELGYTLAIKLCVTFLLVIFSVYQCMGVAHRLVKRYEAGESVTSVEIDSTIRKLKSLNWLILILILVTMWLGLGLRS
jgi:uncharacterized membrane protein